MRMKTLLLGSAAAMGLGGAAQAADLSVSYAEPVDYVRVCDAFGTGYYYIPGTDTCLKISGYVRFEARFYSDDTVVAASFDDAYVNEYDEIVVLYEEHLDNYKFYTKGAVTFEARSQTDWGPLVAIINIEGEFDDSLGNETAAFVDDTLLSLGPLYAGYTQSLFDQVGGGYGFIGLDGEGAITDTKLNTIGLNWSFQGFGVAIALEDNRYRTEDWYVTSAEGDFPDIVAALFAEMGNLSASVAFLYMDTAGDNTYGIQGQVEVSDLFGGFLDAQVGASYIDGGGTWGDGFSILAGVRAHWTSNLVSSLSYRNDDCSGGFCTDTWAVEFDTRFYPVENMTIAGAVLYDDASDSYEARIRLQRDFGD